MIRFYQRLLQSNEPPATVLAHTQHWLRSITYAELADWIEQDLMPLLQDGDRYMNELESEIRLIRNNPDKIESPNRPFANPYHWAGFTVVGHTIH